MMIRFIKGRFEIGCRLIAYHRSPLNALDSEKKKRGIWNVPNWTMISLGERHRIPGGISARRCTFSLHFTCLFLFGRPRTSPSAREAVPRFSSSVHWNYSESSEPTPPQKATSLGGHISQFIKDPSTLSTRLTLSELGYKSRQDISGHSSPHSPLLCLCLGDSQTNRTVNARSFCSEKIPLSRRISSIQEVSFCRTFLLVSSSSVQGAHAVFEAEVEVAPLPRIPEIFASGRSVTTDP